MKHILYFMFFLAQFIAVDSWANETYKVPETNGFRPNSRFQFTISPNDRWMIFFAQVPPEERVEKDHSLGNLRLLDLSTKKIFPFSLSKDDVGSLAALLSSNCWSADSAYCVLPPPIPGIWRLKAPRLIIDLTSPDDPQLIRNFLYPSQVSKSVTRKQLKEYSDLSSERFTCSDCINRTLELNLLRAYLAEEHRSHSIMEKYQPSNFEGHHILSFDRKKIYYQDGYNKRRSTLFEFNISPPKRRELTTFTGLLSSCTRIGRMRLSPNQRYLAFQVSYGCTWVGGPELFVIDLQTMQRKLIVKQPVFYGMHWNAASTRLYFYQQYKKLEGLYYLDVT